MRKTVITLLLALLVASSASAASPGSSTWYLHAIPTDGYQLGQMVEVELEGGGTEIVPSRGTTASSVSDSGRYITGVSGIAGSTDHIGAVPYLLDTTTGEIQYFAGASQAVMGDDLEYAAYATGVNADGEIVGRFVDSGYNNTVYTSDGSTFDKLNLPFTKVVTAVINDDFVAAASYGAVYSGNLYPLNGSDPEATFSTNYSSIMGTNNSGNMVGFGKASGQRRATYWQYNAGDTGPLTRVHFTLTDGTEAWGITDSKYIVGREDNGSVRKYGVLWTPDGSGGYTEERLTDGTSYSQAQDITEDGLLVIGDRRTATNAIDQPMYWYRDSLTVAWSEGNLADLFSAQELDGWNFDSALTSDMSDDGSFILGNARYLADDGTSYIEYGFVMTTNPNFSITVVPEPSAIVLLLILSSIGLLVLRRK